MPVVHAPGPWAWHRVLEQQTRVQLSIPATDTISSCMCLHCGAMVSNHQQNQLICSLRVPSLLGSNPR